MSNECKLAPGIWHPISAINDTNRYEPSFLLHCPDLICSDFNPSGVVEGHWCDDEGWQAAVWCGHHDEFHTKFVTPTLVMTIPSIAAPQPPALGGDYDYRTDLSCYFGLSYASWLTLPRVLMEAMPDDWQGRMAALLHEYDDAIVNPPNLGTTVRVTVDGKMVSTPTWLVNYRHPDRQMIAQVFGRANPPKPAGNDKA